MNVATARRTASVPQREAGFSYIEVMIASVVLLTSLLALAGMFVLAVTNVSSAGNTTMALSAARQVMEDVRDLPFDALPDLDGFDTDDPASLPADGPAREIARRWRYALAGDGVGWTFTQDGTAGNADDHAHDQGNQLGAAGSIDVISRSATLTEVRITVSIPGRWRDINMSTLISNL